jgi:predicted ATPase
VNYRPEYSHSWSNKTYYEQIGLDPLGRESADEMLATLLGADADLAPLKRLIIEKTEGTPFFMEEMVQALFEQQVLARNGRVRLTRPLSELKIPSTVQAMLAARIDRLPAGEKDLLHMLAVIGREFSASFVHAVVGQNDDELDRMLDNLQFKEFIYEQPAAGEAEYVFKHALTQEVAYKSMLAERRRFLHSRIGQVIESLSSARIEDHLKELAHHYSRSDDVDQSCALPAARRRTGGRTFVRRSR